MEIKVDPSDVHFNQGTYEFESSETLVKGRDGVYRVKNPDPRISLPQLAKELDKTLKNMVK